MNAASTLMIVGICTSGRPLASETNFAVSIAEPPPSPITTVAPSGSAATVARSTRISTDRDST
ncbi:MAG: hypothetical protein ABJB55_04025 [Actinomycetota bacterium]